MSRKPSIAEFAHRYGITELKAARIMRDIRNGDFPKLRLTTVNSIINRGAAPAGVTISSDPSNETRP